MFMKTLDLYPRLIVVFDPLAEKLSERFSIDEIGKRKDEFEAKGGISTYTFGGLAKTFVPNPGDWEKATSPGSRDAYLKWGQESGNVSQATSRALTAIIGGNLAQKTPLPMQFIVRENTEPYYGCAAGVTYNRTGGYYQLTVLMLCPSGTSEALEKKLKKAP